MQNAYKYLQNFTKIPATTQLKDKLALCTTFLHVLASTIFGIQILSHILKAYVDILAENLQQSSKNPKIQVFLGVNMQGEKPILGSHNLTFPASCSKTAKKNCKKLQLAGIVETAKNCKKCNLQFSLLPLKRAFNEVKWQWHPTEGHQIKAILS